jgi:hypothetical protein
MSWGNPDELGGGWGLSNVNKDKCRWLEVQLVELGGGLRIPRPVLAKKMKSARWDSSRVARKWSPISSRAAARPNRG